MTTHKPEPHQPDDTTPPHRPRAGINVAAEVRRLTDRDRWLLDLLAEHQVLSTEQIAALAFDTVHTARIRLNLLERRGVLARFRDYVRPGSQSWRWTLGAAGATYLAVRDGRPTPRPSAVRDKVDRLSASPRLGHLLAVNQFFVDLATTSRHTAGMSLSVWWSEQTCTRQVTGSLVHPDGHGVWTDHGHTLAFWLEVDRGTEPRHRVLSKLDGYLSLHRVAGVNHTILVQLDTRGRETSLHRKLASHPAITGGELVVATSTSDDHPAGMVWLPPGATRRVRLAGLLDSGDGQAA